MLIFPPRRRILAVLTQGYMINIKIKCVIPHYYELWYNQFVLTCNTC